MEQVKLDTLLISEVSGVDDPANQLPGWMVTKSRGAEAPTGVLAALTELGAEMASPTAKTSSSATSIVAKIKDILSLGAPREEIEMEKDELVAAFTEGIAPLVTAVTDAVSKSVAPVEGATIEETKAAEAQAAIVTAVTKAVTDHIEEHITKAYNEIFEKVIERLEGVETNLGVAARKSLDGQETGETTETTVTKAAPDLGDAIAAAFKR